MRSGLLALGAATAALGLLAASLPVEAQDRSRTRITVQPRSYLDAGTMVKPGSGDRRYHDYAFPPERDYPSYGPYIAGSGSYGASRGPLLRIFEAPGY
jgi:hypothetical protein